MNDKPKEILFKDESLLRLKAGLDKLANAVKETLGPKGRTVIIERGYGSPSVTKDGVSVAKEIDLVDPVENMGAQMAKDVAAKTCDEAGDGTTTATVLAQAITDVGIKVVINGGSPVELKRGMDKAVEAIVEELRGMAIPVDGNLETIARVGAISANNVREVGDILAEAIDSVGRDGVITIEESGDEGLNLDMVEGMELPEGMLSKLFITEDNSTDIVFENPVLFIINKDVSTLSEIVKGINSVISSEAKPPIVIICKGMAKPALEGTIVNIQRGVARIVVVRAPGYRDQQENLIQDLAIATGATIYGDASTGAEPLASAKIEGMGQAERITITANKTLVVGPIGDPEVVSARISALRDSMASMKSEYDKEKVLERIAKLSGAIAVIRVGGRSEVEVKELRDRVEDAMHATRAAVAEGIVPGGGVALLRARELARAKVDLLGLSEEQKLGVEIVFRAVEAPILNILRNAGVSSGREHPEVIVSRIQSGEKPGYNALTDTYEDLIETGVIDPVKVTITALRNAVSIAGMLLTSSCSIVYDRKNQPAASMSDF
jgi:chaperonin GroEL